MTDPTIADWLAAHTAPCTIDEAFDDDADQYAAPAPATERGTPQISRDLNHFRAMATRTADPAEKRLWEALAAEVDAYLAPPAPAPELWGWDGPDVPP